MYVQYGDYTHPAGEPAVTIDRETLWTDAGTAWAERERWSISGCIYNQAGTAAAMDVLVTELEAAYSSSGGDLKLLLPDGTTASQHALLNANTIGGVRVVKRPSYPQGSGPEGITIRHFTVALEAEVAVSADSALLSWHESIRYSGGGPRFGHLEPLVGKPIKQKLKANTIYKAIQQGRAVGLSAYPAVPSPIWPAHQIDQRDIEQSAPRRRGYGSGADCWTEWPVSWCYRFESANPLLAPNGPNRWMQ